MKLWRFEGGIRGMWGLWKELRLGVGKVVFVFSLWYVGYSILRMRFEVNKF